MEELIKITPDRKKAKSILKMVDTTVEMIGSIDSSKFSSNITKEYCEIIRKLISLILLLDGYKTYGEGAHEKLIEYLSNYWEINEYEISLIDEFRITRNKIAYEGFFVQPDFIERKIKDIQIIIDKLRGIINKKLQQSYISEIYNCFTSYLYLNSPDFKNINIFF